MKLTISVLVFFLLTVDCFAQTIIPTTTQTRTKRNYRSLYEEIDSVTPFNDVRFKRLSDKVKLSNSEIETLTFNRLTLWNTENQKKAEEILNKYANPGLGIRYLHINGITGKGVAVAIIDQNLAGEHPEYNGKIKEYHDLGCDQSEDSGSMHGPAVTSLLVGNNIGTAPGCSVYYFAVPSWKADSKYYADALNMIIDINKNSNEKDKIRVVSVSAAPSGKGSPFKENNKLWDKAVVEALNADILVLDCTETYGFISPGYYNVDDPENIKLFKSGWPSAKGSATPENKLCAPCSCRTVAEEYVKSEYSYQYTGVGGLSWSIPYVAGVCALGWQINPNISAQEMKEILLSSVYITDKKVRVINPKGLVDMVSNKK